MKVFVTMHVENCTFLSLFILLLEFNLLKLSCSWFLCACKVCDFCQIQTFHANWQFFTSKCCYNNCYLVCYLYSFIGCIYYSDLSKNLLPAVKFTFCEIFTKSDNKHEYANCYKNYQLWPKLCFSLLFFVILVIFCVHLEWHFVNCAKCVMCSTYKNRNFLFFRGCCTFLVFFITNIITHRHNILLLFFVQFHVIFVNFIWFCRYFPLRQRFVISGDFHKVLVFDYKFY